MIANALADLRFGLSFASDAYRRFAQRGDMGDATGLLFELADERTTDAEAVAGATVAADVAEVEPRLNSQVTGPLLGMGHGQPYSPASVAYRVQRAENSLERMTAQLQSFAEHPAVRSTLGAVRRRIGRRRDDVRAMRRMARSLEPDGFRAMDPSKFAKVTGQHVTVWFGTNRGTSVRGQFSEQRADGTALGRCRVFVPHDREMGSLGRGLLGRVLWGDNRVKVVETERLNVTDFWTALAQESEELERGERQGLVFLHGYCTKFDDAARRTAQLKVDLGHVGPAAFFSRPSLGSKLGYSGDEAAIEGSEAAIRDFLVEFAQRSGANAVHIIAHSMGNRALLRAIDAIANAAASASPIRFGQILLAAPDVDSQLFQNLASAYTKLATRTTLYVTGNDQAVGLSRRLHRFPRVGLTPPVTVLPGIDTVDASRVNLGMLGHNYAAEMRPVLADIFELIRNGTPPHLRFGIRKVAMHWEFAP